MAETNETLTALVDEVRALRHEVAELRTQPPALEALNPGDVAKLLSVSAATVISWVRRGKLKAANIANGARPRFIIQRAAVEDFLRGQQHQPPAPRRRRKIVTVSNRY